ncbi:hypothetical protein DFH07DRAFT_973403 [Mycena maculata]|uniref:Mtf2-like C-terminal domain-containing protein n=1 Tax=Mycena maculata TaxID=230809 RepID=A0AAD7HDG3_9AGAR|nr:hypothetical protein DFH07DRAFT_973403 [Mycena maculata]
MSTDGSQKRDDGSSNSSQGSKWNHVFSDISKDPPQIPPIPFQPGVGPRRPRRQTMTAPEITAFNEVFNLIFDSMAENESGTGHHPSANIGDIGMGELFSTLRRHSKRMKWTAQSDEALDRKKDEMDKCNTDQELLDWAMREVFGESQLYYLEYKNAEAKGEELPMLQPPTYPYLIALLIRTFRDKYRDPHLALSMFDYARHLSIPSYAYGCSTSAYNELLATRWNCFRDLQGVHDAVEEMCVNFVDMDNKTRELVEKVRQEVGERNLWTEENEIGAGAVWEMLTNIERLVNETVVHHPKPKRKKDSAGWNDWRSLEVADTFSSEYNEFDRW